jgi:hypothetical protein
VGSLTANFGGDPTVFLNKNTRAGPLVWTRVSAGLYEGTLAGAFAGGPDKLWLTPSFSVDGGAGVLMSSGFTVRFYYQNTNKVRIVTTDGSGIPQDGLLSKFPVEIRVYP